MGWMCLHRSRFVAFVADRLSQASAGHHQAPQHRKAAKHMVAAASTQAWLVRCGNDSTAISQQLPCL
jgi:hypothetical protein